MRKPLRRYEILHPVTGLQRALRMCQLLLLFLFSSCCYFHYVLIAQDLFSIDINDLEKDMESIFSTLQLIQRWE